MWERLYLDKPDPPDLTKLRTPLVSFTATWDAACLPTYNLLRHTENILHVCMGCQWQAKSLRQNPGYKPPLPLTSNSSKLKIYFMLKIAFYYFGEHRSPLDMPEQDINILSFRRGDISCRIYSIHKLSHLQN